MFLTRSEYDRGVNTFSPEGRLFQVEYAIEAVKVIYCDSKFKCQDICPDFAFFVFIAFRTLFQLGSTSIGIRTTEGVILAAEKRATSKLMVNDAIEKISKVDSHVGKFPCSINLIKLEFKWLQESMLFSGDFCWSHCRFENISRASTNRGTKLLVHL